MTYTRDEVMEIVRAACFEMKLPVSAQAKVKLWNEIERRLAQEQPQ